MTMITEIRNRVAIRKAEGVSDEENSFHALSTFDTEMVGGGMRPNHFRFTKCQETTDFNRCLVEDSWPA